jgi:hypothetical protein
MKALALFLLAMLIALPSSAQVVVVRGLDGAVWMNEDGAGFGPVRLPAAVEGNPDVCTGGDVLTIAARRSDGAIWIAVRTAGTWTAWRSLGGDVRSDPSLACLRDGTAHVFVRGTDDAVWTRTTRPSDNWRSIGAVIDGAPDAAAGAGGRIDVVARGTDGMVWHNVFSASEWLGWTSLRVPTSASPAVASLAAERVVVVTTAADGAVQTGTLTNDRTLTVTPLDGGVVRGSPDASSTGDGRMVVVGRGTDDAAWMATFDGTAWRGWTSLGGAFRGDVGVAAKSSSTTTVAAADCGLRTDQTTWGRQNPTQPGGTRRWNDIVSCVDRGARFPFHVADLEANEAFAVHQWRHEPASPSGQQTWGYDISGWRLASEPDASGNYTWRETRTSSAARNEDFMIYGQRVYAMTSGKIVKCWRNAPENERPRSLHPMRVAKRIAGSGNFVVIEEDDGDRVWYAHAQTGSIPEQLCPINYTLFDQPNNEDWLAAQENQADVPANLQVRVNAGDFLFLAGNSGESTGPHLHVHKQRGRAAAPQPVAMGFVDGVYVRGATSPVPYDEIVWIRLNDEPFPPGWSVLKPTR